MLKKTAVALAIATFGLCNFATFLTRSGVFSSLHAFSQSPIGWLFVALMLALAAGYGIVCLSVVVYVAWMGHRQRRLRRELEALREELTSRRKAADEAARAA